MSSGPLFVTLDSPGIAELISSAKESVCFAGPGIQIGPARAMQAVAKRLGAAMVTVCIDFDERVMRMGYGDMAAVQLLVKAGIVVRTAPGLRAALIIVDREGFIFTPTALYLEAEATAENSANALRLSSSQVAEALARLSPAAKAIAKAQAATDAERHRIESLPVEVGTSPISAERMTEVTARLKEAPPVQFDVARQVRVFSTYFQYVELKLTGAAIQRHRLAIPPNIIKLGGSKDLEGRLRTTFDLIERDGKLSSEKLEKELHEIRKDLTRSLGKEHGRVVLKSARQRLDKRLEAFRVNLEAHQKNIKDKLQEQLNESSKQIVDYYLPSVVKNPPDAMFGQLAHGEPTEADARSWLEDELNRVFPNADALIDKMHLNVHYKEVTFETLKESDFLISIKHAFPSTKWEKPYEEFLAAGEAKAASSAG